MVGATSDGRYQVATTSVLFDAATACSGMRVKPSLDDVGSDESRGVLRVRRR